jgi:hypothetical protein
VFDRLSGNPAAPPSTGAPRSPHPVGTARSCRCRRRGAGDRGLGVGHDTLRMDLRRAGLVLVDLAWPLR